MKTRREFLATTIAAAASLTKNSGQASAALGGLSTATDSGRKDTEFRDSTSRGQDMIDKAEDPRITRARLSGPEHVTKDATVAEMAADGTMTVLVKRDERVGLHTRKREQNRRPTDVHEPHGYAMDDGCHAREAEAHEHSAWNDLHAVRRHTEKQHQSCGQNQSRHSNRTALDDHMAFRC
jgi:hypothetical protein